MNLKSVFKPQYLFRPKQIFLRLVREFGRKENNLTEVVLPWGLKIRINTREAIGSAIWHQGLYDLVVSEALWRLLRVGDTAIDAGANIGHMTSIMALRVGNSGNVLSFEPHPEIFEELQYNNSLFKQNPGIGEISILKVALSDSHSKGWLVCDNYFKINRGVAHIADNRSQPNSSGIEVAMMPLDELLEQKECAVLKLDVEGHEPQVLKGAERTVNRRSIKNIIYEDFNGSQSSIHKILADCGYSLYALGWNMLGPVLSSVETGPKIISAYETPNYLATVEPERVLSLFSRRRWSVFGS